MFSKFRNSTSGPPPVPTGPNPNPPPTAKHYHSTLLLLAARNLPQLPPLPAHVELFETPCTKSNNRTRFTPDSPNRHHENTQRRTLRTLRERHTSRNADPLFQTAIAPAVSQAQHDLEETQLEMRYAAQVENRLLNLRARPRPRPKRESWFGPPTPNIDTSNELRARAELQDAVGAVRPMAWTAELAAPASRPASMRSRPASVRSSFGIRTGAQHRESVMSGVSSVYTPRSSVLSFGTVQGRAETEASEWPSPKSVNSAGSIRSFLEGAKGRAGKETVHEEEEIPELELEMWRPRDVTAGR